MKKTVLILLYFIAGILPAQVGMVELDNPAYKFLSRMKTMNIVQNYDEFEIPKTRKQIVAAITEVAFNRQKLNQIDSRILDEILNEFEYDIKFTSDYYTRFFPDVRYYKPFSDREKYLYYYKDSSTFNLFANVLLDNTYIYSKDASAESKGVDLFKFGGKIRATFLNNFGFMIQATNGTYKGSKSLAQHFGSLRYNYKFNYDKISQGGVDYFDETEGYLLADFDLVKFKIGSDRMNIGYGPLKTILSSNPPPFDYVSMNIDYGIFSFSYFHGKLLGKEKISWNVDEGTFRQITDKYLAYHRFAFNFNRHFKFGVGEMVVYSNRSPDITYLNPFNYYKSAEHANKDRDNSLLFIDMQNNSINGLNLYATLLLDDIDFGSFGTSYYGNQYMLEAGAKIIPAYSSFPIELEMNYIRVSPYTYTHRIYNNNFTNDGFALTDEILSNSHSFFIGISSQFHHRASANINFLYTLHGANETFNTITVRNYGGDYLVGHRTDDPEDAKFLDGEQEILRRFGLNLTIEPIKNYFIILNSYYEISSLANSVKYENTLMNLILELRI